MGFWGEAVAVRALFVSEGLSFIYLGLFACFYKQPCKHTATANHFSYCAISFETELQLPLVTPLEQCTPGTEPEQFTAVINQT